MWILYTILGILAFALLCFCFWAVALLHMRREHPMMKKLESTVFAHRGLHDGNKPENSTAAFVSAVEEGFGIEFDLHLTRDGALVVYHDDRTKRLCDRDVRINDCTLNEVRTLRLPDGSKIPTFEELLEIVHGKIPMLIELKPDGNNAAQIVPAVLDRLRGYKGDYIMESFDPRIVMELKKRAPDIARGQLSQNFPRSGDAPWYMRHFLASMVTNIRSKPDFVAYNVAHRDSLAIRLLNAGKRKLCFWTVRDIDEFRRCVRDRQNPIFEKLDPALVKKAWAEELKTEEQKG